MAIELETLEVLLEVNTARIQESVDKVMPAIESAMNKVKRVTGESMNKVESDMDISKGSKNLIAELEKLNKNMERTFSNMEKQSKSASESFGTNMSNGIKRARPKVSKEIDAMVKEMDAKMGQAKAQQEKIAYLRSQRQSSANKGDTGATVKYDEQITRAQAAMVKFQSQARNAAKSMKDEFESVPESLKAIDQAMDANVAKMKTYKAKMKQLDAQYREQLTTKGSFSKGFKAVDTAKSLKTQGEIQILDSKYKNLANQNRNLEMQYGKTEARAESLRKALLRVNNALGQSSIQTGSAVNGANMTGMGLKQSERAVSKYGGLFNRTSNNITHGVGDSFKNSLGFIGKFGSLFSSLSNKVSKGSSDVKKYSGAWGQTFRYLVPSLVAYQLVARAITNLATVTMKALNSNEQFATSLNQIKVNLLTAFYPIYTAIMPAINAFMSALATLTGQLASFIANVFGTTYQAAKQGASGLYDNVQAMGDTGTAASKAKEKVDKLQRSLMGFDEINRIGLQDTTGTDSDSGTATEAPSVDFNKATGNYTTPAWMKNIQKLLKEFFKPFQDAWKNQGQKVINAWKYALGEIIGLASAIGRSFMEVWTNGTGQRFIENILILLADVLYIIGDIARAFKNAWEKNNRGTRLIQTIFDLLNNTLELLHYIAVAFRNAWNDGTGERIAGNLLEIFINIVKSLDNIAEKWKDIFKGSIGQSIVKGLLDIIDVLLEKVREMTEVFEKWTRNLNFEPLAKSFDRLVKAIKPLVGHIGDALVWFLENALLPIGTYIIEDALPFFFDTLASALELLSNAINRLKPFISWFFDKLIKPIINFTLSATSQWLKFLGRFRDALVDLLNLDTSGFKSIVSDFQQFGSDIWEGLKNGLSKIKQQAGQFVKEKMVDPLVNWFKKLLGIHSPSKLFTSFGEFIIQGLFNGIRNLMAKPIELVSKIWTNMKDTVYEKSAKIFADSKKWFGDTRKTISDNVTASGKWVAEKWQGIAKNTSDTWANVSKWTSDKWISAKRTVTENAKSIWDTTKNRWSDIGKNTRKTWDDFTNKITDTARRAKDNASNRISELKTNIKNRFSDTWSNTRSVWDNIYSKIANQSNNSKNRGSSAFRNLRTEVNNSMNGMKNTVKSVFDNIGKGASDLPSRITKGLSNGVGAIKKAAGKIGDGLTGVLGGAVNGVISGIKWVLEKVGAKSAAADLGKFTVPKYPKYAQGTGYHPGGYAWVNDGSGSNYQEAFQTPDGRTGLFPKQRNMLVNLPKGTSVLNGSKTAQMMQGLPAYKNGVGKWISASSEWLKEKWNGAKDIASDIWSYAKDPSKLLTAAVSKYVKLDNVVNPTLTIAKGAVGKMIDGAKGWVTDKFNKGHEDYKASLQAESSASFGPGAYAPRFKNPPFIQTSDFGNRAALYGRTFHNGMDFAAPLGTALKAQYPGTVSWASSVPSYGNLVAVEVANGVRTLYGHMNSIAVKVGQSVKQNQILGTVGSTGDSTGPHVHYELKTGGTPPWGGTTRDPKTYGQKAINAVNDFKSVGGTSARAVARTIWNGLTRNNYSKQAAAGILGNVEAESSMNPDLDELYGPGYGIVQWTSPYRAESGRSYVQRLMKRAGIRGDYRSAEAQTKLLLWHMRNGQWIGQVEPRSIAAFKQTRSVPAATYAFLKNFERAGIERIDRRYAAANKWYKNLAGYENGGLVTQDGIYRMGEGNKKEMVIPLERPQRAAELIQQAIEYLGLDMFGSSITLPEMFQTPSFTPTNATFSNNEQMNQENDKITFDANTLNFIGNEDIHRVLLAILNAQGSGNERNNGGNNKTEVSVKVDRNTLFKLMIEEGKKIERQTGKNPFNG